MLQGHLLFQLFFQDVFPLLCWGMMLIIIIGKKTIIPKIYIIIFSFIFSIFLIITIGRREFLIEYNHNYENSFLYLEDSKSIADLKNNAMIKDVNEVIKADIYFLLMD